MNRGEGVRGGDFQSLTGIYKVTYRTIAGWAVLGLRVLNCMCVFGGERGAKLIAVISSSFNILWFICLSCIMGPFWNVYHE